MDLGQIVSIAETWCEKFIQTLATLPPNKLVIIIGAVVVGAALIGVLVKYASGAVRWLLTGVVIIFILLSTGLVTASEMKGLVNDGIDKIDSFELEDIRDDIHIASND